MKIELSKLKPMLLLCAAIMCGCEAQAEAEEYLVQDQAAYQEALEKAGPGDVIKLANGTWEDFEIVFKGKGKIDNPIRLTALIK